MRRVLMMAALAGSGVASLAHAHPAADAAAAAGLAHEFAHGLELAWAGALIAGALWAVVALGRDRSGARG
ncbi:MAG: hypothetical protein MI723_05700 [Caulobacterales bacterium]|nr:hypothetical protein [Caulobacterales bacterium]